MKTRNMESNRGNAVPNQFIITDDFGAEFFQSYSTLIAKRIGGQVTLDADKWDYSTTTRKYRNIFLGETKKETLKKIKTGEYKLAKLN